MNFREEYAVLFEHLESNQSVIVYISKFREFGLRIRGQENRLRRNVFVQIYFCPFTGKKLPDSLRDVWFEKLESLGLEPESKNIPVEMNTEDWWIHAEKM